MTAMVWQIEQARWQGVIEQHLNQLAINLEQKVQGDLVTLKMLQAVSANSAHSNRQQVDQIARSITLTHPHIRFLQWSTTAPKSSEIDLNLSTDQLQALVLTAQQKGNLVVELVTTSLGNGGQPGLLVLIPLINRQTQQTSAYQPGQGMKADVMIALLPIPELLQRTVADLHLTRWNFHLVYHVGQQRYLVAYDATIQGGVPKLQPTDAAGFAFARCADGSQCGRTLTLGHQEWTLLYSGSDSAVLLQQSRPLWLMLGGNCLWLAVVLLALLRFQRRTVQLQQHTQLQIQEQSKANAELMKVNDQLLRAQLQSTLLGEMSDLLQACLTIEEAYSVLARTMQPLFPELSGSVFVINASRNLAEAVVSWGDTIGSQKIFTPHECWALRRGRPHLLADPNYNPFCKHLHPSLTDSYFCVPMMAQGEALGVLFLRPAEGRQLLETYQRLAVTVAEQIALALANLKLRETLQNQSIRDSLTGLFNRRYLEESLEREVLRASRNQQSLGVIMIDVDHFKQFNDTYGHDAGDLVLRKLGLFLRRHIRESDIACRYGGEELILILPEAPLYVTCQRAEQIRSGIKHLNLQHRRQPLGPVTLSLGVACFPEHGSTTEALIQAADLALYRAKEEGRDRVICQLPIPEFPALQDVG